MTAARTFDWPRLGFWARENATAGRRKHLIPSYRAWLCRRTREAKQRQAEMEPERRGPRRRIDAARARQRVAEAGLRGRPRS